MERIVLIGGIGRSGTTLLRQIVGSHTAIAMPPTEFKFIPRYVRGKQLREIFSNEQLREWNINFEEFCRLDPKDAFTKTLIGYKESINKTIAGDKTPYYEFYFEILQDWLRDFDFRFIQIIRNPLDVIASLKYFQEGRDYSNAYTVAKNWVRSASIGTSRNFHNPQQFCLIRYEDLIDNSEKTVEFLCDFLDVDYEIESMLKQINFRNKENSSFSKNFAPTTHFSITNPASRKHFLSKREVDTVGSICGEVALSLGYRDIDFISPSPSKGLFQDLKKKIRIESGSIIGRLIKQR